MAGENFGNEDLTLQIEALTRMVQQMQGEFRERFEGLEQRVPPNEERRIVGGVRNIIAHAPNRIEGVKLNIPPFKGRSDPEAYLEWELKIEHVFTCNEYLEEQKVKLAAAEFLDYALIWWNKLQRERQQEGEPMVNTWAEMKRIMRKRHVPRHYARDFKLKLQRLTQGNKGVEEYYKEMKVLMIQANVEEDEEVTMVRFLNGLTNEIRDIIELQKYVELSDLLHKATQAEQQLKRKSVTWRNPSNFGPTNWRDRSGAKKEVATPSNNSNPLPKGTTTPKAEEALKESSRDQKCFKCHGLGHYASQCPTKRAITLKANEEYISESNASEEEKQKESDLTKIKREERKSETLEREKNENKKSETLEGQKSATLEKKQHGASKKREENNILLANQPLHLKNCENQISCTNHFVNPKLSPSVILCLQDLKDETSMKKSYGSLEHYCQELILVVKGINEEVEKKSKLKVKSAMFECMVRPFQFIHGFGKYVEELNHPRTKIFLLDFGQRKDEHHKKLQRGFVFDPGGKNGLIITCFITYSCLFVVDAGTFDLRSNLFQEGGNDENMTKSKSQAALQGLGVPMIGARTKSIKEALKQLLISISENEPKIKDLEPKVIICIKADEDP